MPENMKKTELWWFASATSELWCGRQVDQPDQCKDAGPGRDPATKVHTHISKLY